MKVEKVYPKTILTQSSITKGQDWVSEGQQGYERLNNLPYLKTFRKKLRNKYTLDYGLCSKANNWTVENSDDNIVSPIISLTFIVLKKV